MRVSLLRLWRVLWCGLLLASAALPAAALTLQSGQAEQRPVSLNGHMALLRDASGTLTVDDVAARAADFVPVANALAQGFTHDAIWVRFTLARENGAPERWWLDIGPTFLDDVRFFEPDGRGGFTSLALGDRRPFAERPVRDRDFVFPLRVTPEPAVYYLRLQSTSALFLQARLWQREGLRDARVVDDVSIGLVLGAIGVMFLFNLIFWVWFRERVQIYYAAYLATMAAHLVLLGGYAARWLFPHQPWLADHGVGVIIGLNCAAAILFAGHALDLPRLLPWVWRAYQLLLVLFIGVVFMALMGQYGRVVALTNWAALTISTMGVLMPAILLWRGHRRNLIYLLAFVVFALGNLPSSLRLQAVGEMDAFADTVMRIGTVLHLVLLNVALVARVREAERNYRSERREALEAALEAERELEQKVAQRTRLLQQEVERRGLLESQLREALDTEKEARAQQGRFVAMVSHEFRTPLAIIHATAQSLAVTRSAQDPPVQERVKKIGRAVGRLSTMIDNYLTEDRLSMEALQLDPQPADLRALADQAVLALREESGDRLHIEADMRPLPVSCDTALTVVAISNLVQNALKYAPSDTPVTLRLFAQSGQAMVEVEDRGAGIAAEDAPRIFGKYYRSQAAGRLPGTGLGLYLARTIAVGHGGDVALVRTGPGGTVFRLGLPLMAQEVSISDT